MTGKGALSGSSRSAASIVILLPKRSPVTCVPAQVISLLITHGVFRRFRDIRRQRYSLRLRELPTKGEPSGVIIGVGSVLLFMPTLLIRSGTVQGPFGHAGVPEQFQDGSGTASKRFRNSY